jgi:hypothetical protein
VCCRLRRRQVGLDVVVVTLNAGAGRGLLAERLLKSAFVARRTIIGMFIGHGRI